MELSEILEHYIQQSPFAGEMEMVQLLRDVARSRNTGIAFSYEDKRSAFLLFVSGEPEGAIWLDPKGLLYGNKAVYLMKPRDIFRFYLVEEDAVERLAMVCRILDRNLLSSGSPREIPVFPPETGGVGVLVITVLKDGVTVGGMHVSVRKQGRVVGSGVTGGNGTISFRLLHGEYSCTVLDSGRVLRSYPITLHSSSATARIDLPSAGQPA